MNRIRVAILAFLLGFCASAETAIGDEATDALSALRAGGHVARARPLLLDILRDGCCAAPVDAAAFERLIEEGAPCDGGEGLGATRPPERSARQCHADVSFGGGRAPND